MPAIGVQADQANKDIVTDGSTSLGADQMAACRVLQLKSVETAFHLAFDLSVTNVRFSTCTAQATQNGTACLYQVNCVLPDWATPSCSAKFRQVQRYTSMHLPAARLVGDLTAFTARCGLRRISARHSNSKLCVQAQNGSRRLLLGRRPSDVVHVAAFHVVRPQ